MLTPELVFVTGASGFLGSHVVVQLLGKGYRVRAAARGSKVVELKTSYEIFGDQFEAVAISDIATDQFPEALEGVSAVIHTASPIPDRAAPEVILKDAVDGCLNVIRQAEKAGTKRIVVTSSIVSVYNDRGSFTDQDWNPVTREDALTGEGMTTYRAAKTLAEREVWAFGDAHPDIEITTLNPPYLYGPFAEGFTMPTPNYYALSTNLYIYRLLDPSGSYPSAPGYADVRDVAAAHVRALTAPPTPEVGRKRIILASPHGFNYAATVALIAEKRPELKGRLVRGKVPQFSFDRIPVDFTRIERVLGMKKEQMKSLEETMLGAVDSLVKLEKDWVEKGHKIDIPKV